MRKAIEVAAAGVLGLLILVFVMDVHVWRGYHAIHYLYSETFEEFHGDMSYQVTPNPDGSFDLSLQNHSFAYYPIILYR